MAVKKKSFDLHEHDCDVDLRVISLGSQHVTVSGAESGVDASLADRTIKNIMILDSAAPLGDKPINYVLSNPGGDDYYCAAIYDAIKYSKSPSIITVHGLAMSAGSIILQAGQKRIIMPSSWTMLHNGSAGFHGNPQDLYRWAEVTKRLVSWMEQVYLTRIREKHPDFTLLQLQDLLKFDTFLNAQETVDLGLADEVYGG